MASDKASSDLAAPAGPRTRTPANAVAGFAELIESELLGPVAPVYRDPGIGHPVDGGGPARLGRGSRYGGAIEGRCWSCGRPSCRSNR
jgi:hypothetical protein